MLEQTKKNLAMGVTRVKWIASFLAERTKTETSMAKLFYKKSKLENRMDDLYRDIGKRVLELKERGQKDILDDSAVRRAIGEIEDLKRTVADYAKQAEDISTNKE